MHRFMVIAEAGHGAPVIGETPDVLDVSFVAFLLDFVIEPQGDAGE